MLELKDHHWWGRQRTAEGRRVERLVLARIREEGALPVRAFEGRSGPMWGWKPEKRALEHLFAAGELAIAGRQGFQRRLRPAGARDPAGSTSTRRRRRSTEFRRGYALRAVEGRGALTESGIAEHCRFRGGVKEVRAARRRARRATASCARVEVDDGGPPVVVPAGAELDGAAARRRAALPVRQPDVGPAVPARASSASTT